MKIDLFRKLVEIAYQKEILIDFTDTPDDLIGKLLIYLLSKEAK